ncbi:DUF3017 domain-containing protein [Occultella glacieicola]|uniref:DUF3017 domain-containing protein n=1 Tax=Occultella glacieicola TaxID=2518684 RepID=UPI0014044089|nr:DUF3017 domain-containing protein [Occultella glacieicola]
MTVPTSAPADVPLPAQPRSHAVMWVALLAMVLIVAASFLVGARPASLMFAAELGVLAFVRAVAPRPGPYGISARSRGFDVAFLAVTGLVMATFAITAPAAAI